MFKLSKVARKDLQKIKQNNHTNKQPVKASTIVDEPLKTTKPASSTLIPLSNSTSREVNPLDSKPVTPNQYTRIDVFTGPYNWLGLAYPSIIYLNGKCHSSAYHAIITAQYENISHDELAKLKTEKELNEFIFDKVEVNEWPKLRLKIMEQIQRDKFRRNEDLQEKLIETGHRELLWTNKNDSFFGIVNSDGQNHLGRILQEIRSDLTNGNELIAWLLLCHEINADLNTQPLIRLSETKEGLENTKVIELKNKPYYMIGKLPSNDIVPLNPSVSRRHALITTLKSGGVLIFDLKSKSKTYINGKPLEIDHIGYPLANSDIISLGTSTRKYIVEIDNKHIVEHLEKKVKEIDREIKKLTGDVDTSLGMLVQGSTKIFAGNLAFDTHISDLQDFFLSCGEIKSIHIPQKFLNKLEDVSTFKTPQGEYCTRGIAFIEFYTVSSTRNALLKDGRSLNGRAIKVNISDSKERLERSEKPRFKEHSNYQRLNSTLRIENENTNRRKDRERDTNSTHSKANDNHKRTRKYS